MAHSIHSCLLALATFVLVQTFCQADYGKCKVGEPCSHYLDCETKHVCARATNAAGGDGIKNCKCMTGDDYNSKKGTQEDPQLTACFSLAESPAKCVVRGKCAEGAACGISRDCKGDMLCRKHKGNIPKDDRFKGLCTKAATALSADIEALEEKGTSARPDCHILSTETIKGFFNL